MSPMFNACMQNTAGPGHLGPPTNLNEPNTYFNPNIGHPINPQPPPHFNNQAPPHPINNQIRNIAPRPPNFCNPIYEFKIYELTKRLNERPDVSVV